MTQNQIAFKNYLETNRHQVVVEEETHRANVAREQETNRSNIANERETKRHNQAVEYENTRSNLERESIQRAQLRETQANNRELQRVAWYNASTSAAAIKEAERSAKAREELQRQQLKLQSDYNIKQLSAQQQNAQAIQAETNRHNIVMEQSAAKQNQVAQQVANQNREIALLQAEISRVAANASAANATTNRYSAERAAEYNQQRLAQQESHFSRNLTYQYDKLRSDQWMEGVVKPVGDILTNVLKGEVRWE